MAGRVRRVQLTGGGSYVVTLPKDWVRRWGVDESGEVVVEVMGDGSLRLRPLRGGGGGGVSVRVEAGGLVEALRAVISYYVAGADVIEVVGVDGRRLYELASSRLMGVEPVEEASGRVVLQVVVDPSTLGLCEAFSRLGRTVGFMLSDLVSVVEGRGDPGVLSEIPRRDDVVDKLFLFIWRQVFLLLTGRRLPGEVGAGSVGDAVLVMTSAKHLERIADHVSSMAEVLAGGLLGCSSVLASHLRGVYEAFAEALRVFSRPELGRAEALLERCEALRRENAAAGEALRERCGGGGEVYALLHGARRLIDYTADIAELAMNRVALRVVERGRGG